MVSLIKKIKHNRAYWYLVECQRVNKKPRIVWQKYIGTADNLKTLLEQKAPASVLSKSFGSVASLLSIADELELENIIRTLIPDQNTSLPLGRHILLQAIHRFNEPTSKNSSISWYEKSILSFLWGGHFSSPQTILNQFDKIVTPSAANLIPDIEEALCQKLLDKGIKPSILVWDPTNFFTHIERGESLPQKGHSKEKRFDKNIINLGLVVSQENIPLLHKVYEGNMPETKVISGVSEDMYQRLQKFNPNANKIVFVFDKGNNSKDTIPLIRKRFNVVGSLKKNQLPKLFEVCESEFKDVYNTSQGHMIRGYRTKSHVFGDEYTIVLTFNPASYEKQKKKTYESVEKIKKKLSEIENRFKNKKRGKKTTVKGISQEINGFLHKQYQALFSWDFDVESQKLSWSLKDSVVKEREKTFGKTVLFTDLHESTSEAIVRMYHSKSIIEDDFKTLKDRLLIPVKPINHRLDHRIRVHVFICVLAMVLYRYLLWKVKDQGLTEKQVVDELRSMRLSFVKQEGGSVRKVMETMSSAQIKLYSTLNLGRFE